MPSIPLRSLAFLILIPLSIACEREGLSCDGDTVVDADGYPVTVCRAPELCGSGGDGVAACTLPAGDGEPCQSEISIAPCVAGLACIDVGGEAAFCFAPREQGESCVEEATFVPCADGLRCNGLDEFEEGTCDFPCNVDADCRPDQRCGQGECSGVCSTPVPRGALCSTPEMVGPGSDGLCFNERACSDGLACLPDFARSRGLVVGLDGPRFAAGACEIACESDAECADGEQCQPSGCGAFCAPPAGSSAACEVLVTQADGETCTFVHACAAPLVCEAAGSGLRTCMP